ncbi:MAG: glyoxalase [Herbaspirillum sp.]|jgi:catechol 2,3-dioxygenase-like lactoylglutathione lyase family enzyme|nr:glyoxalase [Herbaspirillum sp.]
MVITGLLHVAIKTANLAATVAFYTKVLGLRETARPDFGYPGAWIAVPTPVGEAVIHIYAGGPALGPEGKVTSGSGAIDHVSITAVGWNAFRRQFEKFGLPWREFLIPNTSYWQLFVYDPSGVQLELTFDGAAENLPLPVIPEAKRYRAGETFFDPAAYADFAGRHAA